MRRIDFVFHFAANADIRDNLKEPRNCVEQNVVGTQNVLEAMRAASVRTSRFDRIRLRRSKRHSDAPGPPVSRANIDLRNLQNRVRRTSHVVRSRVWSADVDFPVLSILGLHYSHGTSSIFGEKLKRDATALEILGNGKQKKSYLHVTDCVTPMILAIDRGSDVVNVFNLVTATKLVGVSSGTGRPLSTHKAFSVACERLSADSSAQPSFSSRF